MPTRRQTIIGIASVAAGSAVVSAGALSTSVSAQADMRIVVVSDLRLEPARDDEEYVSRDEDGEIRIELDMNDRASGLNRDAYSKFGQLVKVINEGNVGYDKLVFSFAVPEETAESLEPNSTEAIVNAMEIVSEYSVTESDGEFTIEHELGPGDEVVFGIGVDLLPSSDTDLPDLSEGLDLDLKITAKREEDP